MKINKPEIEVIFPIPTLHTYMARDFTDEELEIINEFGKVATKNTGNWTSKNHYVLDHPGMSELKEMIMELVTYWFENIICNTTVEPYITQSWLNYTQKEEEHHRHQHPNSYLSGVLYISGDEDKINFERNTYEQIKLYPDSEDKYNQFNSEVTWFSTPPRKIILFPSSITHNVEKKKSDRLRVSLAFNVFVRGTLGKDVALTELKL